LVLVLVLVLVVIGARPINALGSNSYLNDGFVGDAIKLYEIDIAANPRRCLRFYSTRRSWSASR
jgi:hypothetical protein